MKNKKILVGAIAGVALIILIIAGICINISKSKNAISISTPELARAMNYEQFKEGDDAIDQTDNVKFSAFFLRDLDGDGYAEKIKGTCKPIGEQDTLYMEINVQTEGYLKNAKIEIAGKNFYLQTSLPKDEQLKDNYIGNNIKTIEFNQLNNGTQKLLTGIVRSGDYSYTSTKASAIGINKNNYSRTDNAITLTGIYVNENGKETEISKEIQLAMDWYGTTKATITRTSQTYNDLTSRIDEERGTIKLNFTINANETNSILNLSKNHAEGTIPSLNGYAPAEVKMTNTTSENLSFDYNEETRTFFINKTATVGEDGKITTSISRSNIYYIEVTYPIEAYQALGEDTVTIKIPVSTYYEGYNNPNTEFNNPYKSNIASATIIASFSNPVKTSEGEIQISHPAFGITVGKYAYSPYGRDIISKEKPLEIYNGISEEEKDDTYTVRWYAYTGTNGESTGLILKETKDGGVQVTDQFIKTDSSTESMENVTSNIGIYITGADNILKEDGWIKVYDEETDNLLVTFTKDNWNTYTSSNPYKYELPVKHIRVETSETNSTSSIYVYNIKELDDEYITTNYTKEEFDNLQYIKSTLNVYMSGRHQITTTNKANYEEPFSIATISISNNKISTQVTEENEKIIITATAKENNNQVGWTDGSFLVKLPEEILALEINSVDIDNGAVSISTYEIIEEDEGRFIKINTKNNNDTPQSYIITINANITPDPRKASSTGTIELYAANSEAVEYYYEGQDIYDVNDNLNTEELVNKATTSISLISPNSLLTNQTASEYDSKNSMVISPQIAEITPLYVKVDNEKQTAKIGVQLKNNYASTISEVKILGKIPFEGNTTVVSAKGLMSEFTTKMLDTGIEIPEELRGKVTVYYSENETPNRDLINEENGWKTAENVESWDNIKTFLIDFGDETLAQGAEYTFYYKIEIPEGVEFNKVTYSHHGIYFCLDTDEGKYRTQTEPNKLGFRIVEKYNLEIIKTQTGKDKLISGATYSVKEIAADATIGKTKTATTNENGVLIINNLYAERTYEIREIKSPSDYELNEDIIQIIGHVAEDGALTIEKIQGTTKEDITVTKNDGEKHKVTVQVEDEAKAKLKITKKEQGTDTVLSYVKYRLTGNGLLTNGKVLTTNINGEVTVSGLKVNEEYTLEEIKANGYYLADTIKFKIVNNEGIYSVEITEGTVLESNATEEDCFPIANITLENEKIPRYTLEITKIKKTLETELNTEETEENTTEEQDVVYLSGAKFKLYKDNKKIKEYITGDDGKIIIDDLYQYAEGKNEEAIYTLKEIIAPDGYAKVKDITFKVQEVDGTLTLINMDGEEEKYTVEGTTVKLTIEDSPSFKLIKKDAETGETIANVKFAIYNVTDGQVEATNSKGEIIGTKETINGKEYYTVTTDANGIITADLPEGFYKAIELQAPDKFDIEESTYYFGIGGSREEKIRLQAEWSNTIGGSEDDSIKLLIKTSDGGYIAVGEFESSINIENLVTTSGDNAVIKYNSDDQIEWVKIINANIRTIIETSDGGYIVGGSFSESIDLNNGVTLSSKGSWDGMLIKYSIDGDIEWTDTIGGSSADHIYCIKETQYGGYIVGGIFMSKSIRLKNGETLSKNNFKYAGMIVKFNAERDVEWGRLIGQDQYTYIDSIIETSDGGYIVGGSFSDYRISIGNGVTIKNNSKPQSYGDGYYSDAMLIKYSSNGTVQWAKAIGGEYAERIQIILETKDGGYIVTGSWCSESIDFGNGVTLQGRYSYYDDNDAMMIKYSREGVVEWAKGIEGSDEDDILAVAEANDGGFIVGGIFGGLRNLGNGVTITGTGIIKYSLDGEAEWVKKTEGNLNAIAEISDGRYIVGGSFKENIDMGNGITLTNNGKSDGMIIRYKAVEVAELTVKQAFRIGSGSSDSIKSVSETIDGGYIIGGHFSENTDLGNDVTVVGNGIVKYNSKIEVEWAKEVEVTINSVRGTIDGGYIIAGVSATSNDGELIKYGIDGNVEWRKTIEGNITSVSGTIDGGYIAAGHFWEKSINLGNGVTLIGSSRSDDGMLIKYNSNGTIEWGKSIVGTGGATSGDYIYSVSETSDGGYILGGSSKNTSIDLGEITVNIGSNNSGKGILIKYNSSGEAEWGKAFGDHSGSARIDSVSETSDGGYIAKAMFGERIALGNGVIVEGQVIMKFNSQIEAEWEKTIEGYNINSIMQTQEGAYIGVGSFSNSLELGKKLILSSNGESDGMILVMAEQAGSAEVQELVVENSRKEFTITTNIKEIDRIKGGSISGEDKNSYETVKYGDSNTKEIVMTPDENYEIIKITVNGEEHSFIANEDDTYTMPTITNITEDKHIEVTYALKDNKIIINKVDSETQNGLQGATFRLDQIEERTVPESTIGALTNNGQGYIEANLEKEVIGTLGELTNNGQEYGVTADLTKEVTSVLGELTDNGQGYGIVDTTKEVTDVLGELTNNNTSYYFKEQNATYIPNNTGKNSTTANSYITIDLTNKEGNYAVVVNASVSSESRYDFGYATITETTTAPAYNSETGRFIYQSGTVAATDYTSMILEGGKTYYLHLGYRKDSSSSSGTDQIIFNNIKVYEANAETYEFVENEGKYESNNQAQASTVANSYMAIDLTNKEGNYVAVVNANISSQSGDYGYATITENTTRPAYSSSTGRFIYITGTVAAKDYTSMKLEGGKIYYLHLGYYKNASTDSGDDKFTVNSIKVYEGDVIDYEFIEKEGKYESNNQGKASTVANSYIPIDLTNKEGKYALIVNANVSSQSGDYGYATVTKSTTRPAYNNSTGRFIYISGTSSTVTTPTNYQANLLEGGNIYYLHLGYYKNASTNTGQDKFTVNSVKLYETKTLTYNFVENEGKYESNNQGEDATVANSYIPIDLTNCEGKYNLIVNANISSQSGDYGYATITENTTRPAYNSSTGRFIYITGTSGIAATPTEYTTVLEGGKLYYLHFGYYKNSSISAGEDKFTINSVSVIPNGDYLYHTEVVSNSQGQAITQIPFGKYAITEIVAPEGYELNENSIIVEFRADGTHEFTIENNKLAKVIVHHYIKDTTTKVAEDDILQDKAGYPYITSAKLDLEKYGLEKAGDESYIIPENATGQFVSGEQEVIYYYVQKEIPLVVNYYIEGTEDAVPLANGYTAKDTTSYGNAGDTYSTMAISDDELSNDYELVENPSNSTGTYEGEMVQVTYYYRRVARDLTINQYQEDGVTPLEGAKFTITNKNDESDVQEYTTDRKGKIKLTLASGEYIVTQVQAPSGYQLPEDPTQEIVISKHLGDISLDVTNIKEQGKITVHHYIENSRVPVLLEDGTQAQDIIKTGTVGTIYATKELLKLDSRFELKTIPENASGIITKEDIEVIYYYTKPALEEEMTVEKKAVDEVTSIDTRVYYEINFAMTLNYFDGKAKITLVDTLPYSIDEAESELAGGKYDAETRTITWEEEIEELEVLINEQTIERTKILNLKYKYESVNDTTGTMENKVTAKLELLEASEENPDEYVIVKEDSKEATAETLIKIPAEVIVHHYIYDAEKNEYTTTKLVEDDIVNGIIGGEYKTSPSTTVPANYRLVNEKPDKSEGKLTKEPIEVTYYYQLMPSTVASTINKIAKTNKQDANKVAILTREDGVVTYSIKYDVTIKDYIGKATIEIVDTPPAKIDIEKSDLAGGIYDSETNTITWTETLEEDIDTYVNGTFRKAITKQIKTVYKDQDVTNYIVNTVEGKVKTYYPENHTTKPEEEIISSIARDNEAVLQEYKVNLVIEKQWEDNDDLKGKRPENVTVVVSGIPNEAKENSENSVEYILNAENEWKCEIADLPKYDAEGNKIKYTVTEKETKENDLEYYEDAVITEVKEQTDEVTNYVFTVKNAYRLLNTELISDMTKIGAEEITSSKQEVEYTINFKAEIIEYIGEGNIKLVDTLPYKIDIEKSDLANGVYDDVRQTITWVDELPHINTIESGENYLADITKKIKVVYKDIDLTTMSMTNTVNGKVELYESEVKDEKEATCETKINVDGKVIVRYVDMDTGEDIDKNYTYEIISKVGNNYTAQGKEIENYEYIQSTNNETGIITEETQEVMYYYTRIKTSVLVKHQDTEGKPLAEDVLINGKVLDEYKAEAEKIENYRVASVTDNKEGIMTKEQIVVIYTYERIPTKVVVKYMYKNPDTGEDTEISPAEKIEGLAGDEYITERKVITNYKTAEPEPTNKTGKMKPDTIEVIYYYEKIPSGIVTVKYVDIETEEEIIYKTEKGEATYKEEIKGFIGDEYKTEEKEIPYYVFVKNTDNATGILTEKGDKVIYYYQRQNLDFSVEKTIKEISVNGSDIRVSNDKLAKVEFKASKIEETEIIVTYEIVVKNEGEIKGTATVAETVPQGYEVIEKEDRWQENNGVLETHVELDAGEKEALIVKQKWVNDSENLGDRTNNVQISRVKNVPNFKDTVEENNISSAAILVSTNTGMKLNAGTIIMLTVLVGTMIYATFVLVVTIKREKLKRR